MKLVGCLRCGRKPKRRAAVQAIYACEHCELSTTGREDLGFTRKEGVAAWNAMNTPASIEEAELAILVEARILNQLVEPFTRAHTIKRLVEKLTPVLSIEQCPVLEKEDECVYKVRQGTHAITRAPNGRRRSRGHI